MQIPETKRLTCMDIEHKALGEITLSMSTFTEKLQQAFDLKDNVWGGLQTPGRTDKKITDT